MTKNRPHKWAGVVKVQISLRTTHDVPQALIYNKNRTVQAQFDASPQLLAHVGSSPRCFVNAVLRNDGMLELNEIVAEQGW